MGPVALLLEGNRVGGKKQVEDAVGEADVAVGKVRWLFFSFWVDGHD